MKTFKSDKAIINVNDTEQNYICESAGGVRAVLEHHVNELISLPTTVRRSIDRNGKVKHARLIQEHSQSLRTLLDEHAAGRVLLTPLSFTNGRPERVSDLIAGQVLSWAPIGISLQDDLRKVGLYNFIDRLSTRDLKVGYTNVLHLILAGLAVSTSGYSKLEAMPLEAFLAWLNFFREKTSSRWRTDLWGSGRAVPFRCLREITLAYGRLTGNDDIAIKAAQKRSNSSISFFWEDIKEKSPPHIRVWVELFENWRSLKPAYAKTYRQMFMHLVRWLDGNFSPELVADVVGFLATPNRTPTLASYLKTNCSAGLSRITYMNYAKSFSDFIATDLTLKGQGRAVFALISDRDIQLEQNLARREDGPSRGTEAKSRPLPMRLYRMTRSILEEGEGGWPGSVSACRERITFADGSSGEYYCPVFPTLFLSLFHLPLRVGQMKRFDSGEGDVLRFDGFCLKWENNTGPTAGYWQAHGQPASRGYAHRYDGKTPLTGFFVNTNKTGKPYLIPWQNEELHRLLFSLRLWQEEFNPVKQPIPPKLYIDGVEQADEGKMDDYPEIFALFRLPYDARSGRQSAPPNARRTNEFWQVLMAELERRLALESPDGEFARLVKRQEKTGQAYAAKYNPHGLRVAGLTLMLDQKIPIEIISKLIAGHQTVLMTLYYIKFAPGTVHHVLNEAARSRESVEIATCMKEIKSADYITAQQRTAVLQPDGLFAATSMDSTDKIFWADTGIGFCPWDGTRCHDGGKVLKKFLRPDGTDGSTYAPVEGGERNCVLCRHFVSGPAWRNPLWLYGTKLSRQLAAKAKRVERLNGELENLLRSRIEADPAERSRLDRGVEARQVEITAVTNEQEILAKGMWNTHCLLEACAAIDGTSSNDAKAEPSSSALIAQPENSVVEYLEVTDFEQAALLTAAGRIYPIIHDNDAEVSRNKFIDAVLWHSGAVPLTFAPLSEAAKTKGQDALAQLILERVKRTELQALEDGSLKLQDLNLDKEANAVFAAAIGAPLFTAAPRPGPGPRLLGSDL